MRHPASRRRGTALVITVGLLAVLAIIGFGFAAVSRMYQKTGQIYKSATNLDLVSTAGIMYAVRDVRYGWSNARAASDPNDSYYDVGVALKSYEVGALTEPTDSPMNPWFRDLLDPDGMYFDAALNEDYCLHKASSYSLIHDVLGGEFAVSYVAMQDAASKINLNDYNGNGRLLSMLTTLFTVIDLAAMSGDSVSDTGYAGSTNSMIAARIIAYRSTADVGGAFTSLEQLRQVDDGANPLISPRRLAILRNYVTIYSWPHDPPSVVQNAAGDEITPRVVAPHNQATSYPTLQDTPNRRRSPININTAPYPVLVAVLDGIQSQNGGHTVGPATAREIAKWICRKRDPESHDPWRQWKETMPATWTSWLTSNGYKNSTDGARSRDTLGWREYPLGPFDTWNEFIDFIYSLTDGASATNGPLDDPFPTVAGMTEGVAEAIIAAVCPDSFATIAARNTYHLGTVRLNRTDTAAAQELAYHVRGPRDATDPARYRPDIIGKNELASTGYRTEFCFHSRGRYEIETRTFGFIKADQGEVSSAGWNSLDCTGRSWSSAAVDPSLPTQWRGYSVIIYEGTGKGQVRGIVTNDSDTLTVPKWSTRPDTTSKFYILGPGPLLEVEGKGGSISLQGVYDDMGTSMGSLVRDPNATWEDDEWNGARLLIFRSNDAEDAYEPSMQERVIVDTFGGTKKTLVVSPALKDSTDGTHWDYIILGSLGSIPHEAAVKAFDVVYHNTQDDFAPNDSVGGAVDADGYAKAAVGPNPLTGNVRDGSGANQAAVTSSQIDGWVSVANTPTALLLPASGLTAVLRHSFRTRDLEPDPTPGGGWNASTDRATLIDDVFERGRLLPDGLHLRDGSSHYAKFFCSQALVNDNAPTAGNESDAGFVSLWYRPDAVETGDRCIVRIMGKSDAANPNDIRLVLSGNMVTGNTPAPTLKVVVRQDGSQLYKGRQLTDGADPPQNIDVKCRATDVAGKTVVSVDVSAWRPGEWHHICFAWYEAEHDQANVVDSDGKPATTSENDAGADFTVLDENEVLGYVRLWIDGVPNTGDGTMDAFNLIPDGTPATFPSVHIGEEGVSTPGGTIDSLTVYKHDKGKALATSFDGPIAALHDGTSDDIRRYINGETITFQSSDVYLPPELAGRDITLGTVAWTAFYPYPDKDDATQDLLRDRNHYPVRVQVRVCGSTSSRSLPDPAPGVNAPKISPFGGGGPLRTGADLNSLITAQDATTPKINYDVLFEAYHGTKNKATARHWVPMYSQAPVLDDITITYFGRTTYYNWR